MNRSSLNFNIGIIFAYTLDMVLSLSGHVCSRERAETYLSSYNQAFLCQERYTTSCGHLDWRRCTRYRVQTCFTPKQRYMTRYHQIEECCPGWREDGNGQCTVPVCSKECQNGGSCVEVDNMPGCICQEGYLGNTCQHARNNWNLWQTAVLVGGAFVTIILITIAVFLILCCKKYRGYEKLPQQEISIKLPAGISTYPSTQTQPAQQHTAPEENRYPSAPLRHNLSVDNAIPSAPPLHHTSSESSR